VLEIGAGTGRNALGPGTTRTPGRRGGNDTEVRRHDSRRRAKRNPSTWQVIVRDVFATKDDLRQDYQLMALSEVVSDFKGRAASCAALFETRRPLPGLRWPPGVQHLPGVSWLHTGCCRARVRGHRSTRAIFTRHELSAATAGLPLDLIADDSVYEYEKSEPARRCLATHPAGTPIGPAASTYSPSSGS